MPHQNSSSKSLFSVVLNIVLILAVGLSWQPAVAAPDQPEYDITWSGSITTNTVWSGSVHVTGNVSVMSGVTLTINPGTMIYMQAYQGYREPEKRIHFVISGSLDANGTSTQPIYFTSDAATPTNGDWFQLGASGSPHMHLHYVVMQYNIEGLNLFNSTVIVDHSVFRWNNKNGIQTDNHVNLTIDYCQIYGNGWGGITSGNYSSVIASHCEISNLNANGTYAGNNGSIEFRESIFHHTQGAIAVGNHGTMHLWGVTFHDESCAINSWGTIVDLKYDYGKLVFAPNVLQEFCNATGTQIPTVYLPPTSIDIGFIPDISHPLGYIPGDVTDRFLYVYPDDETRQIVDRIGSRSNTTGLAWDGTSIWAANQAELIQYDLDDGSIIKNFVPQVNLTYGQPESFQGITFDDEGFLWGIDGNQDKVYKVDPESEEVLFRFTIPNPGGGSASGIEWDGSHLCMLSWSGAATIYCYEKNGTLSDTILLNQHAQGGLTWADGYWWAPFLTKIYKYDRHGRQVGWIYTPANEPYDLAWDGEHLWVATTTYPSWGDKKIFKVQILDDHQNQTFLPLLKK
jgi:hypothetical protein